MNDPDRLSQIETLWSMVYTANQEGDDQSVAQRELLARYGTAIQSYLRGALRDPVAAEDAYQEFAVKFLNGSFKNANHEKGRFRSFLKVVLSRLVADHFRSLKRKPTVQMDSQVVVPEKSDDVGEKEREFLNFWRDQMLTLAWQQLAEEERDSSMPWMTVLRLRVEKPDLRSADLALELSEKLKEEVTPTRLRVLLHRAREKFSKHLIAAVGQTIQEDTLDSVEQELAELELLKYCQRTIEQLREDGGS